MIIKVDRALGAQHIKGHRVLDLELDKGGPEEYDLNNVVLYRHPDQYVPAENELLTGPREGLASFDGYAMLESLQTSNQIYFCMGLRDAEEIFKISVRDLPPSWHNGIFTFWRSVTIDSNGKYWVPQLRTDSKRRKMVWLFLDISWFKVYSTPFFAPVK